MGNLIAFFIALIQSGNIAISLLFFIIFLIFGYILLFKQSWIRWMQDPLCRTLGNRFKTKTTTKFDRIIVKAVGWGFIMIGVLIFMATLYYAILLSQLGVL